MKKVVVCTGGFDPIHEGHIFYLKAAKKLGDILVVGVNSDDWLVRKKGKPFMSWVERAVIVQSLRPVDYIYPMNDDDGSARDFLEHMKREFPGDTIIFANGGDRTAEDIPEMDVEGVEFVFGVGGDMKFNSSSKILSRWGDTKKTQKRWGYYTVLHNDAKNNIKVKELVLDPGDSISLQTHWRRNELWVVAQGTGEAYLKGYDEDGVLTKLEQHDVFSVPQCYEHKLTNTGTEELRLVEIQYGDACVEEDITRWDYEGEPDE